MGVQSPSTQPTVPNSVFRKGSPSENEERSFNLFYMLAAYMPPETGNPHMFKEGYRKCQHCGEYTHLDDNSSRCEECYQHFCSNCFDTQGCDVTGY